jgi:hypothetical protein
MKGNKRHLVRMRTPLLMVILGLLIVSACKKNQNSYVSYQRGVDAAQHFVFTQQMMTQLMSTYLKSLTDSALFATGATDIDGAKVLYTDDAVKRLYFEYPPWGSADGYGHWRAGAYEALTEQDFREKDALIRFSFYDFSWDKDTLTFDSLALRNLGKLDGTNEHFHFESNQIRVDYELSDDSSYFWLDEYFKRVKDPSTVYTSPEDSFDIWGELSGITVYGVNYTTEINEDSAMINSFSCNWLKLGPTTVVAENFGYPSYVHFSHPDSCLNNYLIEINGNPFPYPID